ncbi:MAG: hypothetical protein EHM55_04080 [Acidobacteria bacterium]|nr:MAG: hypothetical protein EHM55_04080 [Acidobacteriota bacterium]
MPEDRRTDAAPFSWIDEAVRNADDDRAFEQLVQQFTHERQYGSVFNARLMRARLALGLPLLSQPAIGDVPKALQQRYQDAYLDAAREVGQLLLTDGNIPAAWPYFRAVGNIGPIVEAIDAFDVDEPAPPEALDRLNATIQIAFQEGVNPRKGFELMLKHFGMCRAVTMFGAYPRQDGREESLRLLVRSLHAEIVENLKRAISAVEGTCPESDSIPVLVEGRDWLFENNAQYTDSSHLAGLLKFCMDLDDEAALRQAVEMADYGCRLSPMFQYSDDPPFDRAYEDRRVYLRALIGEAVDRAVAHFEAKAGDCDRDRDGTRPAEVLVELLTRLQRYSDAVGAFRRYLADAPPEHLSCPTLPQLCEMAGDFEQLKNVAQEQSDPLTYLAAAIRSRA